MARFKDFGAPSSDEPITFKLHGEKFTAKGAIQGKVLMNIMKEADADNPAESAGMILDFFDVALLPESKKRFDALLEDDDKIVPVETLAEIVGWLMEEYAGRPEGQRED